MDKLIENIINEKFASKAQQRFFYAKANEKGASKKQKKKWSKWADEFSDETNFKKLPEKKKKEEDVDEVVDELGNIATSKEPTDANTKGITQSKTTDRVVKTGAGSMGIHGVHGTHTSLRYWAESDMSKALGFEKTMGDDDDYEEAEDYFKDELGMDDTDAEERLSQIGYDKKLAKKDKDKVRLVENPKKFIEDYIDEVLINKSDREDIISREEKEINPIVQKQLEALKKSLKSNGLSINDVIKYLKHDNNINELFSGEPYEYKKEYEDFYGKKKGMEATKDDDDLEFKFYKYNFTSKNGISYHVEYRITPETGEARVDFWGVDRANKEKGFNMGALFNNYDAVSVFKTILKISESIKDEFDTLIVCAETPRRLSFYKKLIKYLGYNLSNNEVNPEHGDYCVAINVKK